MQRLDWSAAAAAAVLVLVIMRQSDFTVVLLFAAVLAVISVTAVVAAIVCVCVCGTAGPTFLQAAARGAGVPSTSPRKSIIFHFTDSSCVMSQRALIDRQSLPRVTGGYKCCFVNMCRVFGSISSAGLDWNWSLAWKNRNEKFSSKIWDT